MKKIIAIAAAAFALLALTAATFVPANFGRIVHRVVVTGTYTIPYSVEYVACGGATNYTVTLPPALVNGLVVKVAGISAATITIATSGNDTIATDSSSITVGPTNSVTLTSDGTSNWER